MSDNNKNDNNHNNRSPMKTTTVHVFKEPTASTVKIFTAVEDFSFSFNRLLDILADETTSLKRAVKLSRELIDTAITDEDREALKLFHQGYVDLLAKIRHRCYWDFVESMDKRDDSADVNRKEKNK